MLFSTSVALTFSFTERKSFEQIFDCNDADSSTAAGNIILFLRFQQLHFYTCLDEWADGF
jgi:hypothetical protein